VVSGLGKDDDITEHQKHMIHIILFSINPLNLFQYTMDE